MDPDKALRGVVGSDLETRCVGGLMFPDSTLLCSVESMVDSVTPLSFSCESSSESVLKEVVIRGGDGSKKDELRRILRDEFRIGS